MTYVKKAPLKKTEYTYPEILALQDNLTEIGRKNQRKELFFVGGIRHRWNSEKKSYEVLVIDYNEDGRGSLQLKFPGGCSKKDETPRQTLRREMLTETGRAMSADAKILHYIPLGNDEGELDHMKIFFEQEVPYADKTPFLKTVTGSDNNECSPVRWEALDQKLANVIYKAHKEALGKLVRRLQRSIVDSDPEKMDKNFALAVNVRA